MLYIIFGLTAAAQDEYPTGTRNRPRLDFNADTKAPFYTSSVSDLFVRASKKSCT